jgi:hypothetical protein
MANNQNNPSNTSDRFDDLDDSSKARKYYSKDNIADVSPEKYGGFDKGPSHVEALEKRANDCEMDKVNDHGGRGLRGALGRKPEDYA